MNMQTKVSIIMNCFNGEKYLKDSLQSVLNQTYTNWELIFWDNQSKDNSKKIFKSFKDVRFKYYYNNKFTNLYIARNLALKKASGKIISFIDTDDIWHSCKLEKQVIFFKKNKNIKIIYSNYMISRKLFYFNFKKKKHLQKLPSGNITGHLLNNYCVGWLTVAIKKELFESIKKPFNEKLDMISDYELILRLSVKYKIFCIQEPLATYRYHQDQLSRNKFYTQINHFLKLFEAKKTKKVYGKYNNFFEINKKLIFFKQIILVNEGKYSFKKLIDYIIKAEIKLGIKLFFFILFPNLFIKYIMSN